MNKSQSIIIIGAGFAGLSAAALLANAGYKVTVLEKNNLIGGRAQILKKRGFTFDMGPSWYLMPDVFETFFKHFNLDPRNIFKLTRLDPSYRIFFSNTEKIDISSNLKKNIRLFDSLEKNGGDKFKEYLKVAKKYYELSLKHFLYKEYKSYKDFLVREMVEEGKGLRIFDSMDKYVSRFFNSEKIKKILLYSLVFLGGAPKNTPSLYTLMSHVDFNLGVWYPMGGMGKVIQEIANIAKSKGVIIKRNHEVTSLIVENQLVRKIETTKGVFEGDIVVSAADLHHTETNLLIEKYQTYPQKYWDKKTIAPSAFIIYLGLNKKLKNLSHHNLILDNDWEDHFETIFKNPQWPDKPSYYVCVPSITDSSVAPKNKENLFILVPIASGLKDTPAQRKIYYKKIITDLENVSGESISKSIEVKELLSLNDYRDLYNAYKGTALGLSHTFFQSTIFRPGHKSKKVNNLFYTGQYSTPGIGVPMTLISSEILFDEINKQYD